MSVRLSPRGARRADRFGDSRRVVVGLTGAALMVASLSACGGDGDGDAASADGSAIGASSGVDSGQSKDSGSSVQLPDGFPAEVPLPEGATLKTASALTGVTGWRLRFSVDIDEEGGVAKYSQTLKDAGFTVTNPSGVNVSGTSDTWLVDAVIRPPVITFQVYKKT